MAHRLPHVFSPFLILIGALLISMTLTTEAYSVDPHGYFENRCSHCHSNIEDFAKADLYIKDGKLCGRGCGHDIRQFLPQHYGHPNSEQALALYDLLFAQLQGSATDLTSSRGGFKTRCAICHINERELAQHHLVRKDGVVYGRYTGRELAAFLANHGRIRADELDFFVQLLMPLAPVH